MEIKRKTLSRAEWYTDKQRSYEYMYHKDTYFEGAIGLISFTGLESPEIIRTPKGERCIADNGYRWLELVPKDGNWALTAMIDKVGEIFNCYFDITKENCIEEDGNAVFFDAFLDVAVSEEGMPVILDRDELDAALQEGVVSDEEYKLFNQTAAKIVSCFTENRALIYDILGQYKEFFRK